MASTIKGFQSLTVTYGPMISVTVLWVEGSTYMFQVKEGLANRVRLEDCPNWEHLHQVCDDMAIESASRNTLQA